MGNEVSTPQPQSQPQLPALEDPTEMRPRIELLDLPSELILKICTYLPPLDLLEIQLVSSFFHAFVQSSTLRYSLACERYGDVATQDQGDFFPVAERLDLLEQRERNWEKREGEWQKMEVQRESTIYELQGSIFIRGTNYSAPKDATPSEIDHLRPCSIQLHPLPSLPMSSPSAPPISPPPPAVDSSEPSDLSSDPITLDFNLGPFLDLTLDPGQDLIVLATRASNGSKGRKPLYQIHLMDMQGNPREDVKKQTLEVDVTLPGAVYGTQETSVEGVESGRMLLQVLEGTLVCLVSNTVTELEMEVVICWDWKTGEEISRLPVPETLVYPSISLLTPRSYTLLGFTVNGICPILITYHLSSPSSFVLPSPPAHRSSSLHLPPPPRRSLLPTEISSRLFPALHREALSQPIMLLDIRPDPPSSNTPFVFGGPERRRRPHTTDPRKGVLEFDLLAGNRLFYVHLLRDGLVEEVERYEEKARRGEEEGAGAKMLREEPLEWEEWGVKECRLFEAESPVQRSWVTFVEGYRTISHRSSGPVPTNQDIVLRDFAPYRFGKRPSTQTQPSSSSKPPTSSPSSSSSWETTSTTSTASDHEDLSLPNEPIPNDGAMHLVTSPTRVYAKTGAGHTFRKDVTTALPFREGVVKLPEGVRRCEGVMLDGEHLVVTEKGEPGGQTWKFHVLAM